MGKYFNSVGLALNILGVILLFFFGPPQPSFDRGVSLGLEDGNPLDESGRTVRDFNIETRRKRRLFEVVSHLALLLIGIGFILQLIATWSP